MRFLADESCDFGVVLALRTAGHDVAAIAEVSPREEDDSKEGSENNFNRVISKTMLNVTNVPDEYGYLTSHLLSC